MARIDLSPYFPQLDAAVKELVEPPLRIWELFDAVKLAGDVLKAAVPLATVAEYEEALTAAWDYLDEKYSLVDRLDEMIKVGIFEMLDGVVIGYCIKVAIKQLAEQLAEHVG
jgi:hypothetical protein